MSHVTRLLESAKAGDRKAAADLLPLVYDELRKLAAVRMENERPDHTLDATALVHEAYLRLLGEQAFEHRGHFFAAAAEAMRRILVDHARQRMSRKRGGEHQRVDLDDVAVRTADEDLVDLDEALSRLALEDPIAARVVEVHHFAGLSHDQAAGALGLTVYEARQKWAYARAWLKTALDNS
jgi:RNA polymerase sigma factor (TIGR02999 family)